jgi:hypothetical protein
MRDHNQTLAAAIADSLERRRTRPNCNVGNFLAERFDAADRATIDHYLDQGLPKAELHRILTQFGFWGHESGIYKHFGRRCSCPTTLPF